MKNLRVTIWLLLAFAFSAGTLTLQSCGSRKKRVPSTKIATITPEKVEITGELKEYVEIVTGSYDPNDKTPNPIGVGATGDIAASVSDLTYLIRFKSSSKSSLVTACGLL